MPFALPWQSATRVVASLVLSAHVLLGQCPDGTPPPCKGTSAGAFRRVNPPLNERAWIVVPFANVTKTQELDWLRDASVNLLTLDLGRWADISVVDDKRVGDLLRETPGARGVAALTLNDGLSIARRAGAGRLVMGDFLKLGRATRLVANVFDVKTGARIRSVEQQVADPDSLLVGFAPLARGVLAVPPPADARLGALGTSRTDAYQAYLLGVRALNRFDLTGAVSALKQALALDSTFALAHFKLSLAFDWLEGTKDTLSIRSHAVAAQRLGASLPPRERTLIAERVAEATNDFGRACDLVAPLVARDSMDVEALYALGECQYHDRHVIVSPGDTTRGVFRSSWNRSLRAFSRVLQVDPSFHLAFLHVLDILGSATRGGCANVSVSASCDYFAVVGRSRDTLVTIPVDFKRNGTLYDSLSAAMAVSRPLAANLLQARQLAESWVQADTLEARAHYHLASVYLRLNDVRSAYAEARKVRGVEPSFLGNAVVIRFETAFKLGRGAEARALLDSIGAIWPDSLPSWNVAAARAAFGKLEGWRAYRARTTARGSARLADWYFETAFVLLGIPRDSLNIHERAWYEARGGPTCNATCQRIAIFPTLMYGARAPRQWWPEFPPVVQDVRMQVARGLAVGDTAYLRRVTRALDSTAHESQRAGYSENGASFVVPDGYLALRDSVAALRMTRFIVDSIVPRMDWNMNVTGNLPLAPLLWARMMLLRADLAAALGSAAEARIWYERVLDLWSEADAELQPTVQRIRTALRTTARSP